MLHIASSAAQSGGDFVSTTFHNAVKSAKNEFDAAKNEIQNVVNSGQATVLKSLAGERIQEYGDIIKALVKAWPHVLSRLGSEVDVLRHAASQKRVSPKVAEAMNQIAMAPELHEPLSKAASKGIVSFAVEFGGNVAAVGGANGALGFVAELQTITNLRRYGSVGLSLGASGGASGDLALAGC